MIYSLRGELLEKGPGEAVIECAGVGYLVAISAAALGALPAMGEQAMLYTSLHLSENDASLYGFATQNERAMFLLLVGVSGVGPKAALSILSALSPDKISLAVASGDHKTLTAANGVGPKLAQRIVLELKDKLAAWQPSGVSLDDVQNVSAAQVESGAGQAIAALVSLGYSQSEAARVVATIDINLPLSEIIRLALRSMGGK